MKYINGILITILVLFIVIPSYYIHKYNTYDIGYSSEYIVANKYITFEEPHILCYNMHGMFDFTIPLDKFNKISVNDNYVDKNTKAKYLIKHIATKKSKESFIKNIESSMLRLLYKNDYNKKILDLILFSAVWCIGIIITNEICKKVINKKYM